MLIMFSGLDGAGKTTLIAELTQELEPGGHAVYEYEDVGPYSAAAFGGSVGWLPRDGLAPRCDTVKSPATRRTLQTTRRFLHGRLVSALLLPIDLSLFMVGRRAVACTSDVVILDRYLYDSPQKLRDLRVLRG